MTNLLLSKPHWNTSVPIDAGKAREQLYNTLVHNYQSELFRYAFWLSRNQQQAEDVVQETFLRVWRSLDKLRDVAAIKPWLFTIARNEHARLYRRYRPPMDNIEDYDVIDTSKEDSGTIDRQELQLMIMSLDLVYREPLLMQIIGGFSVTEIADVLDLKSNTVLSRLFRARSILKLRFGSEEGNNAID